ncbi:sugar ABC transporter ATP-binding protein [Stieleria marina]|uniref:Galactose/methyl galactoside import ATP-binding protein MglA n=1 Tax=Stieleria marina TaxID=1930275 RepID=A0A517NTM9_9BACT|nr:Galactose/methyl galactoside import ATP-binding protein MglA [Planctomycetes bacterium K23_9]
MEPASTNRSPASNIETASGDEDSLALFQVRGISKRFGPTRALVDVSLSVQVGEVLALIGENGAGKSTLLKTLSGAHFADAGEMFIGGQSYRPKGPSDARQRGVAMIYQELNLAPDLSVEDNILLGQKGTGGGLLMRSRQRDVVRQALDSVGLEHLDPQSVVGDQSVATQQLIEIARALAANAKIILFDEPTSSLPQKDVARLFEIVRGLQASGIGIIYISHFLEEVREVADTYSVLRDGHNVGCGRIDEISDDQIVSLMVGRDVNDLYPHVPHTPGLAWVQAEGIMGTPYPQNVSLSLRRGEIFGIAGLVGAGRTELVRSLFALDHLDAGIVTVDGTIVPHKVRARMNAGFGLLSENRKTEGLAQDLSLTENITMGSLENYTELGLINLVKRQRVASDLMTKMEVKAHSSSQLVSELSGGNQQKVAIARILHQQAEILLMDEPTKGIDVGTKAEIYRIMGTLAAEGKTIVFVSSYLPELLSVCDRIGVMNRGELREVRDVADWTEETVMATAIAIDDTTNEE